MTRTTAIAALFAVAALPAFADHANSWADDDDEVLSQFHDANQARSVGTPGEDEMNGVMERNSFGKVSAGSMDVGDLDGGSQGGRGDGGGAGGGAGGGEGGGGEGGHGGGEGAGAGGGGGHGGGGHGGGHGRN